MIRRLCAVSVLVVAACQKEAPPPPPPAPAAPAPAPAAAAPAKPEIQPAMLAAFSPLPAQMADAAMQLTDDRVHLGRMLYFEKRLSKNHDVSCNSCHGLETFGVDNKPTSPGHKGQLGGRNSPTVYNAALHTFQFWDGRAKDVEEQAKGPILNPVEMAMPDEKRVLDTLASMPEYVEAFKKAFPGEEKALTYDNVGKAIGAFERKLVTPSRWDKFLSGEKDALTDAEKEGFNAFVASGCIACHAGPGVGGQMFQKLGLVKPWPNQKDLGRYEVTKADGDKMMFKSPSLRNITKTGPYFHDGSVATLEDAIKLMGAHQLGREISDDDTKKIVTFLDALTGELPPADFIKEPALPKSTKTTPKADPS